MKTEIIADSKNQFGDRLTTFVITFPRIVLAEFNTHRMFSRNSASSRAIPFEKMVEMVKENPFVPIAWQKDHKGMQGTEYIIGDANLRRNWIEASEQAIKYATILAEGKHHPLGGVTKQLCNRLLEPFMWHTVIVTATHWENFFELRCPQYFIAGSSKKTYYRSKKDAIKYHFDAANYEDQYWLDANKSQAEIHIQAVAELMWDAYNESEPNKLEPGEWHIPFGDRFDIDKLEKVCEKEFGKDIERNIYFASKQETSVEEVMVKIATARCARVSYLNFEGKDDYEADIKLHDKLLKMKHASPFEHCARSMSNREYETNIKGCVCPEDILEIPDSYQSVVFGWNRNFKGFKQYRDILDL